MIGKLASIAAAFAMTLILAGCASQSDTADADAASSSEGSGGTIGETSDADVRSYTIAYVEGEPDWSVVPRADIDNQQWLDPVDISAHAQVCYSDDALYVRMWAEEESVRAEYPASDLLAKTYEDSCLEFFISPVPGDERYLNFEFNPNCAVGAGIGTGREGYVRIVPVGDPYQAVSVRTETGWEIEYTLPYSFIRTFFPDFAPEPGMEVRGNFYKCGDLTVQKHYLTWNPVESDAPNFHQPESFGVFVFE